MPQQKPGPQPPKLQSKQQQHLDTLQSMINAILIETGKALRSANKRGAKTIAHDNDRLQMFMPSAINNFHLALDELESDIVRAKAVIARDLRELRAKEQELENPVPQPSESDALYSTQEDTDNAIAETAAHDASLLEQPPNLVKIEQVYETTSSVEDQLPKLEPLDTIAQAQEQPNADLLQASKKSQDEVKPNVEPQANSSIHQPEATSAIEGQKIDKLQEAPNEAIEAPEVLETNDDMTYESLFGPESAHDEHPDLNFDDFDFGAGDTTADQNQDQGQDYTENDGHIDLSTFGEHSEQPYGTDDVSPMLQGLESYANQVPEEGADINMVDAANNGAAGNGEGEAIQLDIDGNDDVGISGGDLDLAMGIGENETNFDDLLDGLDFDGGGDEETGLEDHEFGDSYYGIGEA